MLRGITVVLGCCGVLLASMVGPSGASGQVYDGAMQFPEITSAEGRYYRWLRLSGRHPVTIDVAPC